MGPRRLGAGGDVEIHSLESSHQPQHSRLSLSLHSRFLPIQVALAPGALNTKNCWYVTSRVQGPCDEYGRRRCWAVTAVNSSRELIKQLQAQCSLHVLPPAWKLCSSVQCVGNSGLHPHSGSLLCLYFCTQFVHTHVRSHTKFLVGGAWGQGCLYTDTQYKCRFVVSFRGSLFKVSHSHAS